MLKNGFTLIELLVVVLIIGILAAIALPQYQYVIYKARYVQLVELCNSIVAAQVRYRLATGNYTTDFDQLDISMPDGGTRTKSSYSDTINYPKFSVSILGTHGTSVHDVIYGSIQVGSSGNMNDNLNYYIYYPRFDTGLKWPPQCRCASDFSCTICQKLGAVYSATGQDYNIYYLY